MIKLLIYIIVMALTTYCVRAVPLVAIQKKIQNRFFRSFLHYVPYAVLAAMVIPAVFTAAGHRISSAAGFLAAVFFSYKEKNIVTVACMSCLAAFLAELVMMVL